VYNNEKLGSTLVTMLYIDNFILNVAFEHGLSPYCILATLSNATSNQATLSNATSKTKF
jgi:hypothetical protein